MSAEAAAGAARNAFNPKVVGAVVVAGIVAFGLFLVLMAYAGNAAGGRDGRAHALSGAAVGFKGLVRLVELGGGTAHLLRDPSAREAEDLLVVTLEPRIDRSAIAALLQQRQDKPTLLILPKWEVIDDPERPGWVRRIGPAPAGFVEIMLEGVADAKVEHHRRPRTTAAGADLLEGLKVPAPAIVQTVSGPRLTPLLTVGGGALIARLGDEPHYVAADPDLFNNQGLRDPASARAALALLSELNSTDAGMVMFELALNGFAQQPSALRLAFEPPFLPLTLALFVAALLAGLHGIFRFGPEAEEARAIAFGKAALVENSAALLKIAGREHRAGGAYAELIREAAARDSGAHLALRDSELDAYLDRVSPADGPRFSELAARARAAESRFDLVASARALFQWKKDLIK